MYCCEKSYRIHTDQRRRRIDDHREEAAAAIAQSAAVKIEEPEQHGGRDHRRGCKHCQCGIRTIGSVKANFCWRSAS